MLPRDWQDAILQAHGTLYMRHPDGFAHLRIIGGEMDLASINAAPFGVTPALDPSAFAPLAKAQLARI
jgi:hypothetical protein